MDTKDYIKIFEQSSELLVVIDTNFAIVAASDAFLKATTTVRENIVERNAFDVFPDNPDDKTANGESIVRASFNRVIKNKTKDALPVIKYDIPKPELEGGGYELKYWQATSSPILDDNNNVKYIIHRTEDVTENETLIQQIDTQKKIGEAYKAGNDYIRHVFMQAPALVCMFRGPEHVYELANEKYLKLAGNKDIIGKPIREAFPELKGQGFFELLDDVYKTGKSFVGNEMPAKFDAGNGKQEDIYLDFVYQATYDNNGKIDGILVHGINVTEQVLLRKKIEDSEKRYNMMLMKSQFAFAVLKGKNKVITLANDRVKKIWGKGMDIEGKSLLEIMPELKDTPFPTVLDEVYDTGIPFHGVDVQSPKDPMGELKEEYFNFVFQPYLEADETISGITIIGYEVTASVMVKKALEAQQEAEQKALKQIEDSEKRYNMMLMKSPFAFAILKGKDMVITLANDSVKEMWGKGKDLEGKPLLEVLPEIKDTAFPGLLDNVYTTGIPFYGDEVLASIFRNGKLEDAYYNFVYQPYLEADETISGVTLIAYEVTGKVIVKKALETQREAEQKALHKIEESEKNLRQVLDSMPQKITNADTEGNVIYFNKKWLDDTGLEFEKLKGWGWEKVIHPDDVEMTKTKWTNSFKTGDVFDMECRILNKEGKYRWHLNRALPIKDENGKIKMWVGTNTEIHEQKEQKEVLEKEVKRRTKQLKQKNVELENVNKDLTAFTYISSHDLQEPLRKIQDFVAVILTEEKQNLSDDGKGYFVRMQETAKRMQTLIEDLLAYSRTSNSEKIFEKIDLNIILDEVKKDFGEDIQQKKATIEASGLCEMNMIRFQFRQLLHNLIGNSLKFSKENTVPRITITSKIEKGSDLNNARLNDKVGQEKLSTKINYYHIIFTDNGIGFKPEYRDRIFEVFQRLHSTKEYRGTGIGLAICKRIVENHKGIITATGELNKGARFDIYIPAS